MRDSYQNFERLMADPGFWEGDLFLEAEEIVPLLDTQDWDAIRLSWRAKDKEYKERFLVSVGEVAHPALIGLAFELLGTGEPGEVGEGLSLLARSSPQACTCLGDREMGVMARVWQENPSERLNIQHILWSKGKSGQLRRFLGLERWSDAPSPV